MTTYSRSPTGVYVRNGVAHYFLSISREALASVADGGWIVTDLEGPSTYKHLAFFTPETIASGLAVEAVARSGINNVALLGISLDLRRALYEGRAIRMFFPLNSRSFFDPPKDNPVLILTYAMDAEQLESFVDRYRGKGLFDRLVDPAEFYELLDV